jgi:hypothetical protein
MYVSFIEHFPLNKNVGSRDHRALSLCGPQTTKCFLRSVGRFRRSAKELLAIRGTTRLLMEATTCFTIAYRLKTSSISSKRVCARLPSACEVANRHLPRNYA